MKTTLQRILGFFLCAVLVLGSAQYLGDRYMPERLDYGATWHMYEKEPENSIDVLCIGASYTYCSTLPAVIYEEAGISVYDVTGPGLTLAQSYYYLQEALKTQHPNLVYLEVTNHPDVDYSKINIGYMPWGLPRIQATFDAAEPEQRLGLLFPLYNYHDRWSQVSPLDLIWPRADDKVDELAGYTYLSQAECFTTRKERDGVNSNYQPETYAKEITYLEKIQKLCRKNDIGLSLYLAPAVEYLPGTYLEALRRTAQELDLPLHDYTTQEQLTALGLSLEWDFYDGRHLNVSGAKKFSRVFARQMAKDLAGQALHDKDSDLWNSRIAALAQREVQDPLHRKEST